MSKVNPVREGLLNWIVTKQQDCRWLIMVTRNQELTPLGIEGVRGNPDAPAVI